MIYKADRFILHLCNMISRQRNILSLPLHFLPYYGIMNANALYFIDMPLQIGRLNHIRCYGIIKKDAEPDGTAPILYHIIPKRAMGECAFFKCNRMGAVSSQKPRSAACIANAGRAALPPSGGKCRRGLRVLAILRIVCYNGMAKKIRIILCTQQRTIRRGLFAPHGIANGEQHEKRGISGAAYVSQKEVNERSV